MAGYINVSSTWRSVKNIFINVSGTWKKATKAFVNIAGTWKNFYSAGPSISQDVTISQSTPASPNYTVTLTGTNYIWSSNTGETYSFDKSSDNGATWVSMSAGTAVNSGVYTYTLVNNGNVVPNVQNLYRFTVSATNSDGTTTSISPTPASVYGPENITLSKTSQSTSSVTINWTSAPHANRYMVEYKQTSSGTWITSGNGAGGYSTGPVTITSLYGSTSYDFRVIPWTGSVNSTGYPGNYSNTLTVTTDMPSAPIQLTRPTISGTGQAFTSITTTAGTYQTGSYTSITSFVGVSTTQPTLIDGLATTSLGSKGSSPYKITQGDATTPSYYFYAVDLVTIAGGTSFYYYSSGNIKSYIGSIQDTFARTVSTGSSLGVMTPAVNSTMTPNSYIYSSYSTSSAWAVDGAVASNTTNPAIGSTNSAAYPFQTVELTGKTDLTISVQTPDTGSGGPGVMFWATSAGSWYAVAPYQYLATVQGNFLCNQTGGSNNSGCPADNSGVAGGVCGCSVSGPAYACDGSTVSNVSSCPSAGSGPGGVCNCTYTGSSTSCTGSPSGTYYNFSSAVAVCGSCVVTHPGTASFQTANSISYPSGSSCTVCSYANNGCVKSGSVVYAGGLYTWSQCVATPDTYDCNLPVTGSLYSYQTRSSTGVYTYTWNTNNSGSPVTTYFTNLRVYSAAGSTVSVLADDTKTSNTINYNAVGGVKVSTSGDVITAGLYSDSGLTNLIGTNTSYTATGSTKKDASGASSAGIFKTGSYNQGSKWDNLSIT